MLAKSIFRLPTLKLRGTIILAAAAVFTLAIGASLFYVVSSNRQHDLQQADEVVNQLAITESEKINAFLAAYAAAASSTARTAEALIGEPNASPSVYGAVVTNQLKALPEALGVYMMFSPDAKLANSPVFGGSKFKYASGHVGVYATRAADGQLGFQSLESPDGKYVWLDGPMAANKPEISGPDDYSGVLYTSFTDVIHNAAGKPVGMTGVSFDGKLLATLIGGTVPMGSGFMGVINQKNVWVVNPDPEAVGKPIDQEWAIAAMQGLQASDVYASTGEAAGQTWKMTAHKVTLPGTDQTWAVIVAVPQATLLAASEEQLRNLLVGGGVILIIGLGAFALLGSWVAKPVSKMNAVMLKVAEGAYDVEVPYGKRKDEIGDMAKAVDVFRQNAQRVAEMTEADAARIIRDQDARAKMMAELQRSFGQVVDSAVAGDFTRRVDAEFPDAELNALAGSVNNLVATVDRGLSETGEVLAALANTDLTKRKIGRAHV